MRRIALLTALLLVVSVSAVAQSNGSAADNTTGNFTDNDTTIQESINESNVSTVILTSSLNYPDAAVSSTPSNRIGAPILLTDSDDLSSSTREAMQSMNVEKAFIVGGPAVISQEVESEVESITENSTTRLWGETQIETATAVSEFFWTESEEATIVQYPINSERGYKLLTPLKSYLLENRKPLLISDTGNISEETMEELERLKTEQVEVFTTKAKNITSQLENAGIANPEIHNGSIEELREGLRNETITEQTENITVVAAPNFNSSLSSTSLMEHSLLVTAENETETVIDTVNRTQDQNIRILGDQELSKTVDERIESSTNLSTTLITESPVDTVAQIVKENVEVWSHMVEERLSAWRIEIQESPGMKASAQNTIDEAATVITATNNPSEEAQELLESARDEFEMENFFSARNLAFAASSKARVQAFLEGSLGEIEDDMRENDTANEANQNQSDVEAGSSQINISANSSAINSSISYLAHNTNYSVNSQARLENQKLNFTYEITSTGEASGEALTELRSNASETNLEPGNYTVNVMINVDGETVNQISQNIQIIG